jgi:hypothetical protein
MPVVEVPGARGGQVDLLQRKIVGESAGGRPRCPHHQRWMHQGRCKGWGILLRRKIVGESIRGHLWCPRCRRWMRQGQRKGRADLLRRETTGESATQHGRRERLLDVDPPQNQATSKWCRSRGRGIGATRCSRRGRERRRWWCRCRCHHGRHSRHHRG